MNQNDKKFFEGAIARDLKSINEALDAGADINVVNANNRTALTRVAKRGFDEVVE